VRLGVGIVGLGPFWESRYLPALRALSDRFEVRAICEQVAHRARRAALDLNATAVDGFRVLTARDDIDAILYLADQWYGTTPILAACEAGKAVYSAVSLPLERAEAEYLWQRVEKSGIAFMAELSRRHAPATLRLKELIATRLGAPRMMFCHRRVPQADDRQTQAQEASQDIRDLMELIDWCCYVVGCEPTSVVAVRHAESAGSDRDDYRMMSLDFSAALGPGNGPLAQMSSGHYIPRSWEEAVSFRPPAALQVACTNGIAFVDLPSSLVWFDTAGRHQESLESERPIGEAMLLQFHRCVTSLLRRMTGLEDTLRAMRVVEAATESQQTGRRILIPPPARPEGGPGMVLG
jgi:predicted dehydrogenase